MHILTVIGARPQFIKAATVSRVIRDDPTYADVRETIVHTGQHFDANMSDIFFDELDIPKPDYNLGIGGGTHGENTGRMLEHLDGLIARENPDVVLVYGDTDSTLAGALAAAKLHVPVAHVEAGLRSFNRKMPEEINRVLVDHISDFLFAPTETACKNLDQEGIDSTKVHLVGDVMYDAALFYKTRGRKPDWFDALGVDEFNLCTIHRAENTNNRGRLANILAGLANSRLPIVLPIHPRTAKRIREFKLEIPDSAHLVEPVGYLEMVWLEAHSQLIVTDSGGVQKEAYFHGKHCVTLRDETEWVELVEARYNELTGADPIGISAALNRTSPVKNGSGICGATLYGSGRSATSIVAVLEEVFRAYK